MPVLPSEPKTRSWLLVVSAAVASILALFAFDSFDSTIESSSSSNDSFETIVDHRIAAMLEAAQDGNVLGYLECFDGTLHETLAKRLQQKDRDAAAAELKASEADLKNYVISDWSQPTPAEAQLTLERTYSGFNKWDRVWLRQFDETWKIVKMSELDRQAPEIPYGTPVFGSDGDKDVGNK